MFFLNHNYANFTNDRIKSSRVCQRQQVKQSVPKFPQVKQIMQIFPQVKQNNPKFPQVKDRMLKHVIDTLCFT